MSEAFQLAIDPYILCLPNPCNSLEEIESFVDTLLGWSSTLQQKNSNILISDAARIALLEDGEYPHQHRLRDLMRIHKCEVADPETVGRLTQSLLDRTPSLEAFYGVNSILIDPAKSSIMPDAFFKRLKDNTRNALIEMLVIVSAEQNADCSHIEKHIFLATSDDLIDKDNDLTEIECVSELHDWQWLTEPLHDLPTMPATIEGKLPLVFSHYSFLHQLGIWHVWNNASDEQAAIDAINLCIEEIVNTGATGISKINFRLGTYFLESVRAQSFGSRSDYARVLIESCARITLDIPKNPVKPFRESANSMRQKRRHDGALAFRTHLTKGCRFSSYVVEVVRWNHRICQCWLQG